jgi:hypothetical protein
MVTNDTSGYIEFIYQTQPKHLRPTVIQSGNVYKSLLIVSARMNARTFFSTSLRQARHNVSSCAVTAGRCVAQFHDLTKLSLGKSSDRC